MAIAKNWFARHWLAIASVALACWAARRRRQSLHPAPRLNPIYLVSDPNQKWKLAEIFLASLTRSSPAQCFSAACSSEQQDLRRVYFADLAGSGLSGLVFLGAMYVSPVDLIAAPLTLWAASCVSWCFLPGAARFRAVRVSAAVAFGGHFVVARIRPVAPRGQRLQGRLLRAAAPRSEKSL